MKQFFSYQHGCILTYYLIIDDVPLNVKSKKKNWAANHWRDQHQRNAIARGFEKCNNDDLIMIRKKRIKYRMLKTTWEPIWKYIQQGVNTAIVKDVC